MKRVISELIRDEIEAMPMSFIDVVNGMVEPLKNKVRQGDNMIDKLEPIYRLPLQKRCAKGNDYRKSLPETSLRSLIYIEAQEPNFIANTTRYNEYEMDLTVVLWCNLKRINKAYETAEEVANHLLALMPSKLPDLLPYTFIRLQLEGVGRDLSVFNNYDFNEAEHQMFLYPFDFATINYRVLFRRMNNCTKASAYSPSGCYVY
jgi:hypothetical protein